MGRTLACSDIHGIGYIWNTIKNFLQPDDKLYILGDCGDRGLDGWKIIKEALADPRVTYIRGNHDQMILDAWQEEFCGNDFYLWISNGGQPTYEALMCDKDAELYLQELNKTKLYERYENKEGKIIHLSHAGFTLMENDEIPTRKDLLWDREHLGDSCNWWPESNPNEFVVHGHTPFLSSTAKRHMVGQEVELDKDMTIMTYCHGHKINIDAGSFIRETIALLDLDTFDHYVIKRED